MKNGPCKRHRSQYNIWKKVFTECNLYELPLTCEQTQDVESKERGQITFHHSGRLGNNMYQYLAAYAMAKYLRMTLVISSHWDINTVFKLPGATLVDDRNPGAEWAKFIQDPDWNYDNRTLLLDPRQNIQLCGFFQSYQYIRDHDIEDDIIHREFQIHHYILDEADLFLNIKAKEVESRELRVEDMVFVGVHVRMGDIERLTYLHAADKEYFRKTMKHFTSRFPGRVVFVVCSLNLEWCEANLETERPMIFSKNHSMGVDFAILTQCNHTITKLGSFGAWAGYLAGGSTIGYADPVNFDELGHRPDGSVCTRRDKYESLFPRVTMMWKYHIPTSVRHSPILYLLIYLFDIPTWYNIIVIHVVKIIWTFY